MNNRNFLEDVAFLREKRVIVKDKEITDNTGVLSGNLSSYLNGGKSPSRNFLDKFYAHYGKYFEKEENVFKKEEGIPIYEVVATAGQSENVGQLVEKPTERIRATGFDDCTLGMYVYGHSMYPTVENGSVILTKKVSKRIIMYGEVYLVRTADYLMVKRLQKSGVKGHVLCTSDNYEKRSQEFKRFEPFDVPLDEIIDLYLVKGILKKTQT